MATKILDNGTLLTLGIVGVVAAAGAFATRGSRAQHGMEQEAASAQSHRGSHRGSRARNLDYGSVPSDAHEGRMIRGTLRNLESDAHAMRQMLNDDDDLPQWVHAKVETSADRVSSAQRYLRAKIQALK